MLRVFSITSGCDIGWTIYRVNQSYCFMESEKEWGMASLMCADIGGHLLQVEDHEENDFIQSSTGNIHFGIIWLGISDEDEEGNLFEESYCLDYTVVFRSRSRSR